MWVGIVKESFKGQLCIQGRVRFEQADERKAGERKADNKFCKEGHTEKQFGIVD